jgi:hypothetical protein
VVGLAVLDDQRCGRPPAANQALAGTPGLNGGGRPHNAPAGQMPQEVAMPADNETRRKHDGVCVGAQKLRAGTVHSHPEPPRA